MGTLSDRLAFLLRGWGSDASARQAELHALASLEEQDAKRAVERFHELKRAFAAQRRAELLGHLRRHAFVRGVPPDAPEGMSQREIEREIAWASSALALAREAAEALREAEERRAALAARRAEDLPEPGEAPWTELRGVAERAEARRRAVAREARVEARLAEARRRAGKLAARRVEVPDLSSDAVPDPEEASRALDAVEARLAEAERVEDAHRAVAAALRDPAIRTWLARTLGEVEAEAARWLGEADAAAATAGLRALLPRAEALRAEAARLASEASRARRSGRAPPRGERRSGDAMDGYG